LVFAAILLTVSPLPTSAQQMPGREISFPVPIRWTRQKGVANYRLQIASDARFHDIFLDRRVSSERHVVTGLPSGYYYWRVTSADSGSANFSRPVRFFVSGGVVNTVRLARRGGVRAG
jgi:hypothetical protein